MRRSVAHSLALALAVELMSSVVAWALPRQPIVFEGFPVGTIVIRTSEHQLYFVVRPGRAFIYSLGVGRLGRKWQGSASITRKVIWPAWAPPPDILKDNPALPALFPPGGNNPLGVAVLVLGDGTYGIHGTNKEKTIGKDVSYGCFRMMNADIVDLYSRTEIGTPVIVQK